MARRSWRIPALDWQTPLTTTDPPPLKWSDLRYVFDSEEGHDGKEALQG
jgi:hypothetical protein